jgi:uncharacterized protein YyaL (SSP411 family)
MTKGFKIKNHSRSFLYPTGDKPYMNREPKDRPNRLITEKSPYLLQHAYNPVDWYPWGEEAFGRAQRENKPVFLSIGYSTCHWCHVMAHESFEDPGVARLMNDAFVCIKVDREERPDIDSVYMSVCQLMTGSGGWPLTIVMTADKRPFFAGTYFPKENRYGRLGMRELVPRIKEIWFSDPAKIAESAERVTTALKDLSVRASRDELDETVLDACYRDLQQRFDAVHGGFGTKPKFPTPHTLLFLLRMGKHRKSAQAQEMVEKTLLYMRRGGMYDHIGYGFHRYSTDEEWLLPHFEKMLYDQAMLLIAYCEAYQATKNETFKNTAAEICTYVLRDMTMDSGGFYSAEDADSEGVEGKFYLWSQEDISGALTRDEAELIRNVFGVEPSGNYREEATGEKKGSNILHMKKPLPEIAAELDTSYETCETLFLSAKEKLFAAREGRVHPHKDDKVLTDWNGLMIAALSIAARVLGDDLYQRAAEKGARFIMHTLRTRDGRLLHRYREGEKGIDGYLDDYAFMIWGCIELYETGFDAYFLEFALELCETLNARFLDPVDGGYFLTPNDAEKLPVRTKEGYDGAVPSGNSVMMYNLLRLSYLTRRPHYYDLALGIEKAFSGSVRESPAAHTMLLAALGFRLWPVSEVVITGDMKGEDTRAMLSALNAEFVPNKVVSVREAGSRAAGIEGIAGFALNLGPHEQRATAYVCINRSCHPPTTDPEKMMELLGS